MRFVASIDPRTGATVGEVAAETTIDEVAELCDLAAAATGALERLGRAGRASLLEACADALESRRDEVVAIADRETALGLPRLNGELTRTCFQFRLFAEVLRDGAYLEATIDHAGDTAMGPRPDLRRMLVALGPVAVFGSSNFPLAFSVPGGDTASALAAGCAVVVKAHPSHPETSQLCHEILHQAIVDAGGHPGTIGLVHGMSAGRDLVRHPTVRAVGFTGSTGGGQALMAAIEERDEPIPFYGELSGLNPIVVTPEAAAERGDVIGRGLAASVTLGSGQFCTKPGLAFVPKGADGDRVVDALDAAMREMDRQWLLNENIALGFLQGTERLQAEPGIFVLARGNATTGEGFQATPLLLTTDLSALSSAMTQECFGPVAIVARYPDEDALSEALASLPASLTATVHTGAGETKLPARLARQLERVSGRLVFNGYPTGVAVSWAQNHGGPWPSTNSLHTSVGSTAIRRFLRPFAWQDAPEQLLPDELQDREPGIPRRVDGRLMVPGATG